MANSNKTHQTAVIHYTAPRAVNIGDVFYRIEHDETVYFHEPCRVCDGTRKLTVKGVTFDCPCCNNERKATSASKFLVRRYRVYGITDEVGTREWKPSNDHDVKIKLYRKCGHGHYLYYGGGSAEIYARDFARCYNTPYQDDMGRAILAAALYDDYKTAVQVCEKINAAELRQLDDYNAAHGTQYVAVFNGKETHDPKSN